MDNLEYASTILHRCAFSSSILFAAPESRQPALQDHHLGRLGNTTSALMSDFASLGTELGQKSRAQADLKANSILLTLV